ncbi:MAG: DUF6503 family protein [Saprospiraceae bacterium]|nr:DUF6503 family protein [Saprospiraceae bacterium]
MKRIFQLSLLIAFVCYACTSSTPATSESIIQKAIEAHGGFETWSNLDTTQYQKHITLFYEDGTVEKEIHQTHTYYNEAFLSGTIAWMDSIPRQIVYNNGTADKINGNEVTENSASALNTFNAAYYVLNMPWKLKDPDADITYLGLDSIMGHSNVHVLQVVYPNQQKNDTWEYYFNPKDGTLLANKVFHGATSSFISNDEYVMYKGLKFNAKRTSYTLDSLGKVLFVRAKYVYDFSI